MCLCGSFTTTRIIIAIVGIIVPDYFKCFNRSKLWTLCRTNESLWTWCCGGVGINSQRQIVLDAGWWNICTVFIGNSLNYAVSTAAEQKKCENAVVLHKITLHASNLIGSNRGLTQHLKSWNGHANTFVLYSSLLKFSLNSSYSFSKVWGWKLLTSVLQLLQHESNDMHLFFCSSQFSSATEV